MRCIPKLGIAGAKALGLVVLLLGGAIELKAQVAYMKQYPLTSGPGGGWQPIGITAGPDGALWFTEWGASNIGRITTAGVITEFPIPTAGSSPWGIAAGPDGALWFTEWGGSKIGRITTAGVITEFPTPTANSLPWGIAAAPDGALWFTEPNPSQIGRITTAGVITEYRLPTASPAYWITAGPDGALWFTEGNKIGRITTAGVITEYPIPTPDGNSWGIAAGSDGALWFTEYGAGKIGRITTAGVITEYPIPTANSGPWGGVAGPDGALWFTEYGSNPFGSLGQFGKIGRITTAGIITEFPTPTEFSQPVGITKGPDGALWLAERVGEIVQVVLSIPPKPPSVSCTATPNTLWPPNGKSVPVTVAGTFTAGTSPLVPGSAEYTVSDEYGQVQPSGGIAMGVGGSYSFAISLLAARNGNDKNGRTYTIVVGVEDTAGKVGSCTAVVTVPHDQGH